MGLDMYLDRFPRYRGTTAAEIDVIGEYFGYQERSEKYASDDFETWCGHTMNELPGQKTIDFYRPFYQQRYASWDTEHKFGFSRINENIGYWRKANAIHQWFVDNVQDGEDDCQYHREVTEDDLIELRDLCIDVVEHSPLAIGKIKNGDQWTPDAGWQPIIEDGKYVLDPAYAKEHLPTQSGFFFGNEEYNEWYIDGLLKTIKICNEALETTDFDTQMLYYRSSW